MRYAIVLLLCFTWMNTTAQNKKLEHLDIVSSTVCDMCETTIEQNLIYERGVKSVDVDLATSVIHLQYDPRKTTPEVLRTAVTKLGYSADGQPGDETAFKNLPDCCQKEGCGKLPEKP